MPRLAKKIGLPLVLFAAIGCGGTNSGDEGFGEPRGPTHRSDWLPSEHAVQALLDMAQCATCHGSDFAGGKTGVACTDCHMGDETNTHPVSWGIDVISRHRPHVLQNGTQACSNRYCHGADLLGVPGSGPSCSSCHPWPVDRIHPPDWLPRSHSEKARSDIKSCALCHGEDFMGGVTGVACTDCHMGNEANTHPVSWDSNTIWRHFNYVRTSGFKTCSNPYCHGGDLDGVPESGPSCALCHPWPVPHYSAGWLPRWHMERARSDMESCKNCHGEDYLGGIAGVRCTDCHLGDERHVHPLNWEDAALTQHGPSAQENGLDTCSNPYCHGTELQGVPESGPSCGSCHADRHHRLVTPGEVRCTDCHVVVWDEGCQCLVLQVTRYCTTCHTWRGAARFGLAVNTPRLRRTVF